MTKISQRTLVQRIVPMSIATVDEKAWVNDSLMPFLMQLLLPLQAIQELQN